MPIAKKTRNLHQPPRKSKKFSSQGAGFMGPPAYQPEFFGCFGAVLICCTADIAFKSVDLMVYMSITNAGIQPFSWIKPGGWVSNI
jgi:hypothetical protein